MQFPRLRLLLGQPRLGGFDLLLPRVELLGGLLQGLFAADLFLVGLLLSLLQLRHPLAQPEPRGAHVVFELGDAGVQLRLAMIEVLLPRAEVFGQLGRLRANLRVGRLGPFGDRLRRGRLVERFARFGLMGDVNAGFRRASRGRRGCVLTIVGLGCGHNDVPCLRGRICCRRGKVIATGKVFPTSYIGTRGGGLHIPRSYTTTAAKNRDK